MGLGDLCYSILPWLLQFKMFLEVCNTSFLTKKCPQSCIQNYWQMLMIFCSILVVHTNSCLRLIFFSILYLPYISLSPSPLPLLSSPRLPHLSLSMLLSPSPLSLSLFCPPSPFLLPHSLTFQSPYLPLPPSPYLPLAPSLLPLLPSFSSSPHSSISIDYVNLVFVVVVGPVSDAVFVCRMPLCMWLYNSLIDIQPM